MSFASHARYVFTPHPHTRKISLNSPEFFSGSSFKPLHLTHQPWVSTYLRSGQSGYQRPRLPFAVQYAHLHGGGDYSSSPSYSPNSLLEEQNSNADIIDSPADSKTLSRLSGLDSNNSTTTSEDNMNIEPLELDYFSLPHHNNNRIIFQDVRVLEEVKPVYCQVCELIHPGTGVESPSNAKEESCQRHPSIKRELPITAFQHLLLGVITTADDAFGYSSTTHDL
ncbi:hypothetical protein Clacol_009146 [Clathrus columnatus]|uniref:Uncharacterized protein n=1 Tax=Clathrus columnatus TaxID=1419009 RepID=A0AAV5AMD2_9AGAM|nr:hypothetical protein Clacol_009146 [Clathrus columnatus]